MIRALSVVLVAAHVLSCTAFVPVSTPVRSRAMSMSVFDAATTKFAKSYPSFYAAGMGPTTKAERWNGRHAMFGWVALLATGYAKGHGLIPNADIPLALQDWGDLAVLQGATNMYGADAEYITQERAVILAAHIHALFYSIAATIAPFASQDKLFLSKGEEHEPAVGLIPPLEPGLSKAAELWNGRLAMLGLVVVVVTAVATGQPILDVINTGVGGLLF